MKNLLVALALLVISAPAIAEDQFSLGTGFDYSSGKYGDTVDTKILYIPVTAKYETGDLTLKLTVPYISITGPGGVIQGMGSVGAGRRATTTTSTTQSTTSNSGLGDITASAGYNAYSGDALSFDVVANVKLGTADSKTGLGSGENDYSAQIDAFYTLDETTLFGTAGYKKYGAVTGVILNNVSYSMAGISQKLGRNSSAGLMLYSTQSSTATGTGPRDVTLFVSQKISSSLKLQANVLKGLTIGSADYGGGVMLTGLY